MKQPLKWLVRFRVEIYFLLIIYLLGLYFRLIPRLRLDPHLLTFNADIWYRLCISQYIYDTGCYPQFSLRYLPYTYIPSWYPPIFPHFLVFLAKWFRVDLPTVCSRIIPFFESLTPLPFFFLNIFLYGRRAAIVSTLALSLTTSFVYWNGIADPQSFISFILPVIILIWVIYTRKSVRRLRYRILYIVSISLLLAVSFLTHLMYFLIIVVLLFITIGLIIEQKARLLSILEFLIIVGISQFITTVWWYPKRLYWWWIKGLVTSSGYLSLMDQMREYGWLALGFGVVSLVFLFYKVMRGGKVKYSYLSLPIFWAVFPLLETQNEFLLRLLQKTELAWSPLFKPLEGFRFHPYLAQPLALSIGIVACLIFQRLRSRTFSIIIILFFLCLFFDIKYLSRFDEKISNAGIGLNEYQAAVWFRNNSNSGDLIAADYYRSQMIAGVCGGKTLLGLPFPLRNIDVKFISRKYVQKTRDDIYMIYHTPLSEYAYKLMERYRLTHIFVSSSMDKYSNFGSLFHETFGADINREKFNNEKFFDIIYNKNGVLIVRRKD